MTASGHVVRAGSRRVLAAGVLALGLWVLVTVGLAAGPAAAATRYDDRATRFHVDIELERDGSARITENITWQLPAGGDRHGIERLIKVRAGYQDREDVYREYPISDIETSSPSGAPAQNSVTSFGAFERIRVGDPDQTVSGSQQYVVSYRLGHYVNDLTDHAEFYFNLIDASSQFAYQQVSATVTGPEPVDRVDCFFGPLGSTTQCTSAPGASAEFSAPDVVPGQGVSILASLPRTAFADLAPTLVDGEVGTSTEAGVTSAQARAATLTATGAGITLPLLAAGAMGALVYTRGRDERYAGLAPGTIPGAGESPPVRVGGEGPTVVRFTPPDNVPPGLVGTITDEAADPVDVSATVVDLAQRGFLTMEEVGGDGLFGSGKDWQLTALDPPAGELVLPYEQKLLSALFASGSSVALSSLKNTFASTLASVRADMEEEVVQRGWFRSSPTSQKRAFRSLSVVMTVGAGAVIWFNGRLQDLGVSGVGIVTLIAGLVVASVVVGILSSKMAARTALGSAVNDQAKGFKQYLVTAEANQIKFEEANQIFSRYLPYAIVYGVAERWASTFEEVATAAAAAGTPLALPYWYIGSSHFGSIGSDVTSFASTAGTTFTSTPGSSGGSGFSGGGGFSSGGGGGSSGGSW